MPDDARAYYALTVHVKPGQLDTFLAYEGRVLPLLVRYGGRLEERLRTPPGHPETVEIHLVSFPSPEALDQYRADPERARHQHLFDASVASAALLPMQRVEDSP